MMNMMPVDELHFRAGGQNETPNFMREGMEPLRGLAREIDDLQETLADIEAIGGETVARRTRRMSIELDAFAPAVTFIGQIKSGKTTLVNSVAGRPGLLPADVNPWTSVVTSLHLGHLRGEDDPVASFSLFDENEWENLIENGGRIGELSARAGADQEHERLVAQIKEMREKTKARLGRKFELLLGQTHKYKTMEDDLIQRYVCLGDDFESDTAVNRQGQFADITKSAELYLDGPNLPVALTLRDTPGMNDTFLMREQITIRAIRDSRICVVVLSAHQALNSVDMGLIRMISNVKSRQVVIFVNRIDELPRPQDQIPEIRASLIQTLADHHGPEDPCIIFGSAMWASAALNGDVSSLPEASWDALLEFQSDATPSDIDALDPEHQAWIKSGVPALYHALGERIAESDGEKLLAHVRRRARNIMSGLRASTKIINLSANSEQIQRMTNEEIARLMQSIKDNAHGLLDTKLTEIFEGFDSRVDQAHARYISRALDGLLQHLERHGDNEVWSYSADGLRLLMRTAYQVMVAKYNKQVQAVLEDTAFRLTEAYGHIFDVTRENFSVQVPPLPDPPAPVSLAQTIVLDVSTAWWKRWWGQRRGYRSFAKGFQDLIEAETTPMVNDLKVDQIEDVRKLATDMLEGFLEDQINILRDIVTKSQISIEDLHELFGVTSQEEREDLFEIIFEELGVDPEEMRADQ